MLSAGLSGCSKEEDELGELERSHQVWLQFKEANQNSYSYVTRGDSWAGGYSWETQLLIREGKVAARHFYFTRFMGISRPEEGWNEENRQQILRKLDVSPEEFREKYTRSLEEELEWTELDNEIGVHTTTPASQAWTLDQIYVWARHLMRKDPQAGRLYLETENQGMISLCGYVPVGCADACFEGIRIHRIRSLTASGPSNYW